MSGSLISVRTNGNWIEDRWAGTKYPKLETLQDLVGGYIERVKVRWNGKLRDAFVDEDGIRKDLVFNQLASNLCEENHQIFGPMVIWVPDPRKRK